MGRGCALDEWTHFQKLPDEGKVPNSFYWYVLCRHCVAGYERKQLLDAPIKLTGRRSAMRAHLKICPIYAKQSKIDQEAIVADKRVNIAAESIAAGDTTTMTTMAVTMVGEKRKRKADEKTHESRGGRVKLCMMEEWKHFTRLQEEGYIGKSNFFYAVCVHCRRAYEEAKEEEKTLLVPEKIVGRREKMRKHLSVCPNYKGDLPPLEHQLYIRGSGSAVLSTLAAGYASCLGTTIESSFSSARDSLVSGAGQVSTTAMMWSSRLALDEWHFFTRLERKRNSAYYYARCNFCQHAYESAPANLKTSLEPAIVMGRKSNMHTHLSKCRHVPKNDTLVMAKIHAARHNLKLGDLTASTTAISLESSEAKPVDKYVISSSLDSLSIQCALLQFVSEHHLPFEWVESGSAKQLFRALMPKSHAMMKLIPSAIDLRSRVLNGVYNSMLQSEMLKLQEVIPHEVTESAFSADAVDMLTVEPSGSWPLMMHCILNSCHQTINMQSLAFDGVITNGRAFVPLSFIQAQQPESDIKSDLAHSHELKVARWLDKHIRLCIDSSKLVIAALSLPYNAITQRAVRVLHTTSLRSHTVFLFDIDGMLRYPLLKLLATTEMLAAVSSLIELWQLEAIRSRVMKRLSELDDEARTDPFRNWESCASLIQVLLDEKTFGTIMKDGATSVKKVIEHALKRSPLERLYNLLHVFLNIFSRCRAGMPLTETLNQLNALFTAAEGFSTVQLALEVVWEQMEQPLYVLAHVLNPQLRSRDLKTSDMTKISNLTDFSVSYFESFFGRKPKCLRGEVSAYLHTSQRVFKNDFVAEFSAVDDYFRYLGGNHASLSLLMTVLHSFTSISRGSRFFQQDTDEIVDSIYTPNEHHKLSYLNRQWGIASNNILNPKRAAYSRSTTHNDHSGTAMLNAEAVVIEWKGALESKLRVRGVAFSHLDDKHDSIDDMSMANNGAQHGVAVPDRGDCDRLGTFKQDDELVCPLATVRTEYMMKVPLKDLFKTAEATI